MFYVLFYLFLNVKKRGVKKEDEKKKKDKNEEKFVSRLEVITLGPSYFLISYTLENIK